MTAVVFAPVDRQRLFYNKYQYSVSLTYPDITCLEYADSRRMLICLKHSIMRETHWLLGGQAPKFGQLQTCLTEFEPLHSVIWAADQFVTRCEYKTLGLYSNDHAYLQQVVQTAQQHLVSHNLAVRCAQARVVLPSDVVLLSKPDGYNFRSFLSERRLTDTESTAVKKFLLSRQDQFRITPSLRNRLMYNQHILWLSGFLDHVNEQDIMMLNMVVPGIVRRTLPIQTK